MNFHFGVVTIFLILNVISAWSTGNGSLRKKRTSSKDQFSSNVTTDSSIQSFINHRSIQNSFLQPSNSNRNRSFLSNNFTSQTSDIIAFPDDDIISFLNNNNNTFLNSIKNDTTNAPVLNTPAPDNDFISHVPTSSTIHPSVSSSLTDLLSKTSSVKGISELKCEEYEREIAGTTSMSPTDSSSNLNNDNGSTNPLLTADPRGIATLLRGCDRHRRLRKRRRRTVGAEEVQVGEISHMVALGQLTSSNEFTLMCGGTLISHIWVLTAAHCTHGPDGGPNAVKMGINKLSDQEGVTILIKRMIRHPDYKPPAMYADIALVQLMNAVTFSTVIRPACLYQRYDNVPRKAWISGWGVTEFDGEPSDQLLKARLDVIDNLFCIMQHNFTDNTKSLPDGIRPSMICAGDPRGNWTKDSCQGDSGGPLQVYPENKCLFQVVGVISYGVGCGLVEMPSVYTRVSYYLSWIEDIVWPQEQ